MRTAATLAPAVAGGGPARTLAAPARWRRTVRRAVHLVLRFFAALLVAATGAAALAGGMTAHALVTRVHAPTTLEVRWLSPPAAFLESTPVPITITASWQNIPRVVPLEQLLRDHTIWQLMYFNDWDRLPPGIRARALTRMVERYRYAFAGPFAWRRMRTEDWDRVPQPVRAMAYLRMVWYWAEQRQVGVPFGIEPRKAAESIAAIVMSESWFEHRAVNENQWGNRDLGLAQCSDYCRGELARMAESGEIDFTLEEPHYFNPWHATRVATVWFERELWNARGDVELAIRAYHRGIANALDEKGDIYVEGVERRRRRYIRNQDAPPAWTFVAREVLGPRPADAGD